MGAKTLFRSVADHESYTASTIENRIEDVRVRNYDEATRHRVDLAIAGEQTGFEESYTLGPGGTQTATGVLDPGRYTVSVTVDNCQHASATCRIEDPTEGVVVEMGNGIVSVAGSRY